MNQLLMKRIMNKYQRIRYIKNNNMHEIYKNTKEIIKGPNIVIFDTNIFEIFKGGNTVGILTKKIACWTHSNWNVVITEGIYNEVRRHQKKENPEINFLSNLVIKESIPPMRFMDKKLKEVRKNIGEVDFYIATTASYLSRFYNVLVLTKNICDIEKIRDILIRKKEPNFKIEKDHNIVGINYKEKEEEIYELIVRYLNENNIEVDNDSIYDRVENTGFYINESKQENVAPLLYSNTINLKIECYKNYYVKDILLKSEKHKYWCTFRLDKKPEIIDLYSLDPFYTKKEKIWKIAQNNYLISQIKEKKDWVYIFNKKFRNLDFSKDLFLWVELTIKYYQVPCPDSNLNQKNRILTLNKKIKLKSKKYLKNKYSFEDMLIIGFPSTTPLTINQRNFDSKQFDEMFLLECWNFFILKKYSIE